MRHYNPCKYHRSNRSLISFCKLIIWYFYRMKFIVVCAFTVLSYSYCAGQNSKTTSDDKNGVFVDSRDHKTYKTVKIGSQVWFAENFAYLPMVDTVNVSVYGYKGNSVKEVKKLEKTVWVGWVSECFARRQVHRLLLVCYSWEWGEWGWFPVALLHGNWTLVACLESYALVSIYALSWRI